MELNKLQTDWQKLQHEVQQEEVQQRLTWSAQSIDTCERFVLVVPLKTSQPESRLQAHLFSYFFAVFATIERPLQLPL